MSTIIMHSYTLRDFPREEAFAHAAECGYDGIELQRAHFKEDSLETELPLCIALAEKHGLFIHCVDFTGDITNDEAQIRDDSTALIEKNIRICGEHRVGLMNGFTGFLVAEPDNWGANGSAIATDVHFERVTEALKCLVPVAEASNVTLALEVHMNTIHDTYGTTRRLLDAVPSAYLKANPDPGNTFATSTAEHAPESLDILGDRIGYFHLKNCVLGDDGNYSYLGQLAEGQIDFIPYLRKLHEVGYDQPYCIEYVGEGDAKAAAREDILTLKQWLSDMA